MGPPSFDQTVARVSFDSVDLSPLRYWARERTPNASDDELDRRISANLRFIFYNMLNRNHFIVAPDPTDVISNIAKILELEDRLGGLLRDGHRLMAEDSTPARQLVRQIGGVAKQLHDHFTSYFTEGYGSDCELDLEVSDDPDVQLAAFLAASERISQQLVDRTDDYFLSPVPGSVSLNQYKSSSITALSATLERVSKVVVRRLDAAKSR